MTRSEVGVSTSLVLSFVLMSLSVAVIVPSRAAAQGMWFDIGDGTATTIRSAEDPNSTIYFPPYPFGEFYPLGTLVYAELTKATQSQFAAIYWAFFDDGGCGCSGQPSEPITYTLHYDEAALTWPEPMTKLYERVGGEWADVGGAVLDTTANTVTTVRFVVYNTLQLAIGGPSLVPVESSTWGRIKALYEGR